MDAASTPSAKPAVQPSQGRRRVGRAGWWRRLFRGGRAPAPDVGASDVLKAILALRRQIEEAVAEGLADGLEEAAAKLEESKAAKKAAISAENRLRHQLRQLVEDAAAGRQAAAMGNAPAGGPGAGGGLVGAQGGVEPVHGLQEPGSLPAAHHQPGLTPEEPLMKLPFEA